MKTRGPEPRRGIALVMALAMTVVIESLLLVALNATAIRIRLAGDARRSIEGALMVATALGVARVAGGAILDTLSDGAAIVFPAIQRDGWTERVLAVRSGPLIRLLAMAEFRAPDGIIHAAHRASLLLVRGTADTVRVLGHRPRF